MKNICFLLLLLLLIFTRTVAQTTKEELFDNKNKMAGVHFAYPSKDITAGTPIPKGYEPFYISHLGRHGSRYLISDSEYKDIINLLEDAKINNSLTDLGVDVLSRLQQVWKEVEFRGGDLSSLGVSEQRDIAERMYKSFPGIFTNDAKITACATTIVRCVLSMDAFCERLKEFNPTLVIDRNSGTKWQRYLNFHTKEAIAYRSASNTWKEEYRKFEKEHVKPDRLIKSLFSDSTYIVRKVNPEFVMWNLASIAGGMQNIETDISFYDLFMDEELFDLWQCKNYKLYVNDANCSLNGGIMMNNGKPLLRNILESAENIISTKSKGGDFRFAHDGNIIPLAMLLHLDGCYNSISDPSSFYKVWSDFRVSPMAANIQIIFFKKKGSDNIIVKFLHNEKEILIPPVKSDNLPYYNWTDLKAFYSKLLN
ncbi:histidine-type phosphatase [Dysgonomonas sp. Marseille-P4677]|uniref:histidine-type phosphatase n=1 Tax=Dysgonomonas sp. Marseille-P4677 TaxID=2364790 RepID=UPI0019126B86|nr:histidine-type phosphatase [Dysgonomonas sp. Marseille-P4677]MBK5720289.1 histidine-type phosphatase [Dysgonomonas sp. Marseille-P4677]